MKLDTLVDILDKEIPSFEGLQFEERGVINPASKEIRRIGVCLNLTENVIRESRKREIDFLVMHHGFGDEVKAALKRIGIGAYQAHLPLDIMEGGLIDSFAEILGLSSASPVDIEYKNIIVPKGALIADAPEGSLKYFAAALKSYFGCLLPGYIPHFNGGSQGNISKVAISTGKFLRPEFVEQVAPLGAGLIVAGEASTNGEKYARERGISTICVGDFASHLPGLKNLVSGLNLRITVSKGLAYDGCCRLLPDRMLYSG
ncbi:Nif3-like dinuclear metal center hexameric protein [Candidatus Woesearchaeota archaeon]|nr:Nif3-like dinuclear metal center hexameric protein [Candidatus Woesearchaeota archaeon]